MVAHRRRCWPPAAGHHLRRARHRPVRVRAPQLHRRGDGRRRGGGPRRRSGWTPRTSTGSRWAGWSRSSWRCAIRTGSRSLVLGATHAGGRRAARADRDVLAFFRPPLGHGDGGGRVGLRRRTTTARAAASEQTDRIAEDIERRLEQPVQRRRRTARSSSPPPCTTATGGSPRIKRADARRPRAARPCHPRRERAPDGRADPGLPPAGAARGSGHLYPTEEPEVDEDDRRFLAVDAA